MKEYYSECFNRDVQGITSKMKSQKFLFKEKFANPRKFQPSKYSGYTVCIYKTMYLYSRAVRLCAQLQLQVIIVQRLQLCNQFHVELNVIRISARLNIDESCILNIHTQYSQHSHTIHMYVAIYLTSKISFTYFRMTSFYQTTLVYSDLYK